MAEAIDIAMTFEDENRGSDENWVRVQQGQLLVERSAQEATIYGTERAIQFAKDAQKIVLKGAHGSNIYEPRMISDVEKRKQALECLRPLPEQLLKAATPIAEEARRILGLNPLAASHSK